MIKLTDDERRALRARCSRWLSHDRPRSAADWVGAMAASKHLDLGLDAYSSGPAIERLERNVAELLGKEAALWFPKGIVAQQAALLAHAAERRSKVVALHPKSHLALDEAGALDRLAGLTMAPVGKDHRHFGVDDLARLAEPLAAVTLELPLRRSGFQALPWDDLAAIAGWARDNQVPFHLDGARLWEVQPWYGRPLAEIAALADSVYVSLYKGLGGIAGCVLAGSAALIAAARPWRLRYGGDLPLAFPMILTALDGLENALPRMADYHHHALDLAEAIHAEPSLTVFPAPPHCNSFQVHFAAAAQAMEEAALASAQETGTWLFGRFEQGLLPDTCFGEVAVGEASLEWTPSEAAHALTALLHRARESQVSAKTDGKTK
jgi:threonine aldolase